MRLFTCKSVVLNILGTTFALAHMHIMHISKKMGDINEAYNLGCFSSVVVTCSGMYACICSKLEGLTCTCRAKVGNEAFEHVHTS